MKRAATRPLLLLLGALLAVPLAAQERTVVSLKDLVHAELRHQGFTLDRDTRVHIYAKGGCLDPARGRNLFAEPFAYGWVLDAATRKVVWTLDGRNSRQEGPFRVADQYVDLPRGSYEAYFSHHGFALDAPFIRYRGTVNIDRRELDAPRARRRGLLQTILGSFGTDSEAFRREWRRQAGHYGMEIYVPEASAGSVQTFPAPLPWRNILLELRPAGENAWLTKGFRCSRPVRMHLYAVGEGARKGRMHDSAWILDARTRRRVWEMGPDNARYAGGDSRNLRAVETLTLPAGEYLACFASDGSHSPADWNGAPPCDPLRHGLTLSLPEDGDRAAVTRIDLRQQERVVARIAPVGSGEDRTEAFDLKAATTLRVHALGEQDDEVLADEGWIEEAPTGKRVWSMPDAVLQPAGGASKNRLVDELVSLPAGAYRLRYRTDGSHAYGDWNARPPREPEHYGITLYTRR